VPMHRSVPTSRTIRRPGYLWAICRTRHRLALRQQGPPRGHPRPGEWAVRPGPGRMEHRHPAGWSGATAI